MPDPCANCHRTVPAGRRRLCRACYDDPPVRATHHAGGPQGARHGVGGAAPTRAAPEPADAPPGAEGKVAERARLGLALWHPLDARLGDDAPRGGPRDDTPEGGDDD